VTAQKLDRILTAYRIGDPDGAYPIFASTGAKLWPGRWNDATSPMIYTSEHYSTAMLEKLVHGNGRLPPNQHWIEIAIPPGVTYEIFSRDHHPGWDAEDASVAKTYGATWQKTGRSLLLLVPSIVARMEQNILINDSHPQAGLIIHSLHRPIWWDLRLFPAAAAQNPLEMPAPEPQLRS
jgi:RES domain-containing protein